MSNIYYRDNHETLKKRLISTPDTKLFVLQAKVANSNKWKIVWQSEPTWEGKKVHLKFRTVAENRKFWQWVCEPDTEYRIVRIGRILPDGALKPIVMEVVEYYKSKDKL